MATYELNYSEAEMKAMNKTARRWGQMPLCYRRFLELFKYDRALKVLDFGSGPEALWAQKISKTHPYVTAYECGQNVREVHDVEALDRKYDVVIGSNVVNVQPTLGQVNGLLSLWKELGSVVIFNYPIDPRKSEMTTSELRDLVKGMFSEVKEEKLVFVSRR